MPVEFRVARSILLALATVLLGSEVARAETCTAVTITNGTGDSQCKANTLFSGTGGSLSNGSVTNNAPGCADPTITAALNEVLIEWSINCVDHGEMVTFQFDAASCASATDQGTSWSDCEVGNPVPSLSPLGLAALGVGLMAAVVIATRRWRRQ